MGRHVRKRVFKKPLKKELDHLCREVVFVRDQGRCRRCRGTKHLQWSHVYSRQYLSVRWALDNSMVLCAGCHLWWHHNPPDAAAWVSEILGEGRLAVLRAARYRGRRPDYDEVKLGLEALRAQYV